MTKYPLKPCCKAGCRHFALPGKSMCQEHYDAWMKIQQAKRNAHRDSIEPYRQQSQERGYNNRWRKARKQYLLEHPICAMCGQPATDVDHIVPHKGDMELFWDTENWQPLCHKCHSKKTWYEDRLWKAPSSNDDVDNT